MGLDGLEPTRLLGTLIPPILRQLGIIVMSVFVTSAWNFDLRVPPQRLFWEKFWLPPLRLI